MSPRPYRPPSCSLAQTKDKQVYAECVCGRWRVLYPDELAADYGWDYPLNRLVRRLCCKNCGRHNIEVRIVEPLSAAEWKRFARSRR